MLKKFIDRLTMALTLMASILLIGIVLCVLLAVFDRTIFKVGFFWTEELARILFVWFAMVAPGIMAAKEEHFQMSFFFDRIFKGKGRQIASILVIIMVIVVLIRFTVSGAELAAFVAPQRLPSIRSASMASMYVSLPVGMGIMAFINILLLVQKITDLFQKDTGTEEVQS